MDAYWNYNHTKERVSRLTYIWELLLGLEQQEKKIDSITFQVAKEYSPYMELSFEDINRVTVEEGETVEINPYYRYHEIFKNLFLKDNKQQEQMRAILFDILIHNLYEIDKYMGMNRKEFYREFVEENIKSGQLGQKISQLWKEIEKKEQIQIAMALLKLYQLGHSISLLKEITKKIFPNCYLYHHSYEANEILLYIGIKKDRKQNIKVELLEMLFLPLEYKMKVYWKHHFGIIDIEETMYLDQMELY